MHQPHAPSPCLPLTHINPMGRPGALPTLLPAAVAMVRRPAFILIEQLDELLHTRGGHTFIDRCQLLHFAGYRLIPTVESQRLQHR